MAQYEHRAGLVTCAHGVVSGYCSQCSAEQNAIRGAYAADPLLDLSRPPRYGEHENECPHGYIYNEDDSIACPHCSRVTLHADDVAALSRDLFGAQTPDMEEQRQKAHINEQMRRRVDDVELGAIDPQLEHTEGAADLGNRGPGLQHTAQRGHLEAVHLEVHVGRMPPEHGVPNRPTDHKRTPARRPHGLTEPPHARGHHDGSLDRHGKRP